MLPRNIQVVQRSVVYCRIYCRLEACIQTQSHLEYRVGYVSAPPIRRRRFGAGHFGAGHFGAVTIRRQNFFF